MLYTVVRGDTLVRIGKRFGTTGRSVAYWNRDTYPSLNPESPDYEPDGIQVGWVLRILPNQEYVPPPDDGESGEDVTPAPSDPEEEFETPSPVASPAA
jgi:hypothetical protein